MSETPFGLLQPKYDARRCNECGICIRVCPGLNAPSLASHAGIDPFKGRVYETHCATAAERSIREGAQSGGAVTAILLHLLGTGAIDRALVTGMPRDGSLRPVPVLTADVETILSARGSKYCPVAVNSVLGQVSPGERIAIVGLACHLHGIRNIRRMFPQRFSHDVLLIGLICDRILAYSAIDYLIKKAKVARETVATLEYRSKERRGWPGDVLIRTKDGRRIFRPSQDRTACKDFFTPVCCRLCYDKMNVFADLTVGDPYGVDHKPRGSSIVIARSRKGVAALNSVRESGTIELVSVCCQHIFEGQAIEERRHCWSAYVKAWEEMGQSLPHCEIERQSYHAPSRRLVIKGRKRLLRAISLEHTSSVASVVDAALRRIRIEQLARAPYQLHKIFLKLIHRAGA